MKKNLKSMVPAIILATALLCTIVSGQIIKEKRPDGVTVYKNVSLKARVQALEKKLKDLERRINQMVQVTVPTDLGMFADENDPTEPGDIKVVSGSPVEINDCDSLTGWEIVSGEGVSIQIDNGEVKEGTGSIRVYVPADVNAILKYTKPSGSFDISTQLYIKMWTYLVTIGGPWENASLYALFGEAAYDEQGPQMMEASNLWLQPKWDISGIAAGSRDAVTQFGINLDNRTRTYAKYLYFDYIIADPGPSEIKAFDGDRVIRLYPKIYKGSYVGDGTTQNVPLPRKGIPSRIDIDCVGRRLHRWYSGMTPEYIWYLDIDGLWTNVYGRLNSVSEGVFQVTGVLDANGETYYFTAFWDD
jgi:hypothetical protein